MQRWRHGLVALAFSALVPAGGCGGDDGAAATPDAGSEAPPTTDGWQTLPLADVAGNAFTIADLRGKPVLVETFATWCSNCRAQLGDTQDAAREIGDDAVVLALRVETDLSPNAVADYAAENGFSDIRFAVLSAEMLAALADEFGTTIANPPSTPKFVIDRDGHAGELTTGRQGSADLIAELRAVA
jgi:thiol-disulfide isomerase/thioredoxin